LRLIPAKDLEARHSLAGFQLCGKLCLQPAVVLQRFPNCVPEALTHRWLEEKRLPASLFPSETVQRPGLQRTGFVESSCGFTLHDRRVFLFQFQPEVIQGLTIDQSPLAQLKRSQFPAFEVLVQVVLTDAELLGRFSG
jgi:hypothetical protein